MSLDLFCKENLENLESQSHLRKLSSLPKGSINFSTNDYLAIADKRSILTSFYDFIKVHAIEMGATSSRLMMGNHSYYTLLEEELKRLYNREGALIFSSGYHMNMGILPALTQKGDLILADRLVHASIVDGIRLSSAQFCRYRHNDMDHLERELKKKRSQYNRIFIVTESLFSMDGDYAPITKLVELKNRYRCILYVDEAHAVGTHGKEGLGVAEQEECISEIDLLVGTFGKAFSGIGAFVVCSKEVEQYLINSARTLIFTTALPPVNVAWIYFLLTQYQSTLSEQRQKLKEISLKAQQIFNKDYTSHIIPLHIGNNDRAVKWVEVLKEKNLIASAIRYPTVPRGTERIRLSLRADHTVQELERVAEAYKKIRNQ